ncbi:MAG TPA: hypothetical protein VHK05_04350 [Candidatus Limnocylindrales bacterium]|jgi:hypothetical protein|nr:hypothetical protein [Candidatus Limnocylindrales bacterium]
MTAIIATQPSGARNAHDPAPTATRTTAMTINAPQNQSMCEWRCIMVIDPPFCPRLDQIAWD